MLHGRRSRTRIGDDYTHSERICAYAHWAEIWAQSVGHGCAGWVEDSGGEDGSEALHNNTIVQSDGEEADANAAVLSATAAQPGKALSSGVSGLRGQLNVAPYPETSGQGGSAGVAMALRLASPCGGTCAAWYLCSSLGQLTSLQFEICLSPSLSLGEMR